jgi:DNA-binding winged helix-turn-helix (wHTH) protein
MYEIGPKHPLTYRQEVVAPLFDLIKARESCAIVGSSGMGKSRLLHFTMQPVVQQHYLADQAEDTLFVLVDANRLAEVSEWGLYELLLTTLAEAVGQHARARFLRDSLGDMHREVVLKQNALLARRYVERAIFMLCQEQGLTLTLILDEFDETYQTAPTLALANLRALRDANKYQLCYVLLLREHPNRLRPFEECESFYELFSRAMMGLGPYAADDARRVLEQQQARKNQLVSPEASAELLRLSGGHPGLIVALYDAVSEREPPYSQTWEAWALDQPTVVEEFQKLWGSLSHDEQLALGYIVQNIETAPEVRQVLQLKGLVRLQDDNFCLFSPIFVEFVRAKNPQANEQLRVDRSAYQIWIGNNQIALRGRQYELVAFLYEHLGNVRTRDQILDHLNPGEYHHTSAAVDSLVRQVRKKLEPAPDRPCYLITVPTQGYKLVAIPETED